MDPATTLVELLERETARAPTSQAFTFLHDGETAASSLSLAELSDRAECVASELARHVAPGARVVLLFSAGLDFLCGFFGILRAGAVAVPVYPPEPARLQVGLRHIRTIADDCGAELVITSEDLMGLRDHSPPGLNDIPWLVAGTSAGAPVDAVRETPSADDLALLQYTSGSTGTPKGVMLSHANLMANQVAINEAMQIPRGATIVSWLPLYHDMGLIGMILQPLYVGGRCVFMSPHHFIQKPVRWLQAITRFRADVSGAPNFAFDLCLSRVPQAELAALDLSPWRVAFSGSEKVQAETADKFLSRFAPCGLRSSAITPCYGLAEASLLVTCVAPGDLFGVGTSGSAQDERFVSCGPAPSNQHFMIATPSGEALPDGVVGEIWVSGPSVCRGYWKKPDMTREAFPRDSAGVRWLRTGDLGFRRNEELFITGRVKELIVIRGRNISPQDVEASVQGSDERFRAGFGVAFSVEREGAERLVVVQEVRRPRRGDLSSLDAKVRAAVLRDHGVELHQLVLVEPHTIPRTANGKLRRLACRDAFLADALATIKTSMEPVYG